MQDDDLDINTISRFNRADQRLPPRQFTITYPMDANEDQRTWLMRLDQALQFAHLDVQEEIRAFDAQQLAEHQAGKGKDGK